MTIRTPLLIAVLFAVPAHAFAQDAEDLPFHDFRISGSVLLGTGHNTLAGQTLSANVNAGVFIPIVQHFGVRVGATFLAQPALDASSGGGAAVLSFGAGLDYTVGLGDGPWGIGIAAGVEGAPWGFLDPGGFETPSTTIRGVVLFQEVALRRAIRVGIWEFGLRGDEFFGDTTLNNVGVFFRFSFRI